MEYEIEVTIPEDATPEEEEAIIQAAIDKETDRVYAEVTKRIDRSIRKFNKR